MSGTSGGRNVDFVVAIMVHGRPNVPAVDAVVGPSCFSLGLRLVGDDFCAKGCQGSLVEIKVAKKLVVCGKPGVESGRAYHIKCCNGLGEESAPQVWRKSFISAI